QAGSSRKVFMYQPLFRQLLDQVLSVGGSRRLSRQPGKPARRKWTACPLAVERLEDRTVPAPLLSLVSPSNPLLPASDSAGGVSRPMISADGRFTVYESFAPNLVLGQVNTAVVGNVFLYDQQTGTTTLVSHTPSSATTGANSISEAARISSDG